MSVSSQASNGPKLYGQGTQKTPNKTSTINSNTDNSPSDTFRQINFLKPTLDFYNNTYKENFSDPGSRSGRRRSAGDVKKGSDSPPNKLKKNFKKSVITNEPSPRLLELIE